LFYRRLRRASIGKVRRLAKLCICLRQKILSPLSVTTQLTIIGMLGHFDSLVCVDYFALRRSKVAMPVGIDVHHRRLCILRAQHSAADNNAKDKPPDYHFLGVHFGVPLFNSPANPKTSYPRFDKNA
jgi:hypothetical protein